MDIPTLLSVVSKLTEGALDPLVWIMDTDVKQSWTPELTCICFLLISADIIKYPWPEFHELDSLEDDLIF
ncbi:hypothetical protein BTVI_79316 [Pitangus sulphuratus]|nr:hypothetical protein BTVI_79316 [Pitangus sulphuratus]